MLRIDGSPARTYVSGETRFAMATASVWLLITVTIVVEAGAFWQHPGNQRQVSPGRMASQDDTIGVDVVLLGISNRPTKGAATVFHRSGGERRTGHSVFHVDYVPAHLEIRQKQKGCTSTVAENPSTAVVVDQRGRRRLCVFSLPYIQLQRIVVLGPVGDVRIDQVLFTHGGSPMRRRRKRAGSFLSRGAERDQCAAEKNGSEPNTGSHDSLASNKFFKDWCAQTL